VQVSHITDVLQTPAMWRLAQFIRHHQQQWQAAEAAPDLERFEQELHNHVMALERDLLTEELNRYDVTADEVTVGGVVYRQSLESSETYLTAAGPVTVLRHLYRPAGRGSKSICPLELRAGIVDGLWTPRAARQGAFVMAHLTPREGAELFRELGGMQPSRSTLDRLPKTLSTHWEGHRESWEETLRARETVPMAAAVLAVSLDGVMAPMATASLEAESQDTTEDSTASKPEAPEPVASGSSGNRHYREASCGTTTFYTEEGERLSTVRYGRMPEYKKATLCSQLEAECQSTLAVRPDLKVVKLADGAEENWRFLDQLDLGLAPDDLARVVQISILDFYHAADHLAAACDVIWGAGSVQSKAEFARLRILLQEDDKGVDKVMGCLRYRARQMRGRKRDQLEKELTYFRNQRARMRYAQYLREGLPIGSGVVEAACKTLVTHRLKRAGMRWEIAGGQAILTLRSVIQSERWQGAWSLLRNDFRQPVHVVTADGPEALDPAA
jgi:hypothetical protein